MCFIKLKTKKIIMEETGWQIVIFCYAVRLVKINSAWLSIYSYVGNNFRVSLSAI